MRPFAVNRSQQTMKEVFKQINKTAEEQYMSKQTSFFKSEQISNFIGKTTSNGISNKF